MATARVLGLPLEGRLGVGARQVERAELRLPRGGPLKVLGSL